MNRPTFEEGVAHCLRADQRYPLEAYTFIRDALDFTVQQQMERGERKAPGHVNGRELSFGCRDYALDQYGPLAQIVLETWNIRETADFGALVFNLISAGVFSQSAEDKLADFQDVFTFPEAFAIQRPRSASPRLTDQASR